MENRRSHVAFFASFVIFSACHRTLPEIATSTAGTQTSAARNGSGRQPIGQAFGDSLAFGARIASFDGSQHVATFQLDKPAYVVFLEVAPGKSIELIAPRPNYVPVMTPRGKHRIDTYVREDSLSLHSTSAYQSCYSSGIRAITPKPAPRPRPVKRDSTGRRTGPPDQERANQSDEPSAQAMRQLEAQCRSRAQNAARANSASRADELYLLMLITDSPISALHILTRIDALTVTASDITSTMEAIAQGLFADRKQTWSGYYVSH